MGEFDAKRRAANRAAFRRNAAQAGVSTDAYRLRREFAHASPDWAPPPFRDGERADSIVRRVVKALDLPESAPAEIVVRRDWNAIVGPEIARHAQPGTLRDGVFTILVRGNVWLAELKRNAQRTLLPRLQAAAGPSIRELRMALAT